MSTPVHEQLAQALAQDRPILIVLAGSNGAGKSTYYRHVLRSTGLAFVNADEIAKAMRPENPKAVAYDAMHLAEDMREDLLAHRQSFIMETVLSDTQGAKLDFMHRAKDAGYCLIAVIIRIESPEISIARVMQRVAEGGHDVPDTKLHQRFSRTLRNAGKAVAMADLGIVLDNNNLATPYLHIETWVNGKPLERETSMRVNTDSRRPAAGARNPG